MLKTKIKQTPLQPNNSDAQLKNTSSSLKTGKKNNKVYVPITETSENIANARQKKQIKENQPPEIIVELKKANSELKEKQQIYIEKLIKLEEGLEKQHREFMSLQDIYNELFSSYKLKQQQIAELQMKFRQSDRKKNQTPVIYTLPHNSQNTQQLNNLRNLLEQKNMIIRDLEIELRSKDSKFVKIQKQQEKLHAEISYLKSKERMNDSKASLNSKMFEEIEEWQKIADLEKESRIRLQYENQFYKTRNSDLESRVQEFQQIISAKQSEVAQLRQNKILLHRENSEARLSRSRSRSPQAINQHSPRKQGYVLTKMNSVIDQLNAENRQLKEENSRLRYELCLKNSQMKKAHGVNYQSKNSSSCGNQGQICEQQFFSFSKDQLPGISTILKERPSESVEVREHKSSVTKSYDSGQKTAVNDQSQQRQDESYQDSQQLEQLPRNLQVQELIKQRGRNGSTSSNKKSKEEVFEFA